MSWQQFLDNKTMQRNLFTQQYKLTPEEDEANNDGARYMDISRGNTRFLRASVMQYPNTSPEYVFGSTYVNLKLFKWDYSRQNYLKHSQTGLNLEEFKALRERLNDLDAIIDDVLNTSLSQKANGVQEQESYQAPPLYTPDMDLK